MSGDKRAASEDITHGDETAASVQHSPKDVLDSRLNEDASVEGKEPERQKDQAGDSSSSQSHLKRTEYELDDDELNEIEKDLDRIWSEEGMWE